MLGNQYCHYCQFCVFVKISNIHHCSLLPEHQKDLDSKAVKTWSAVQATNFSDRSLIICCFILQVIADIVQKNDGIERCLEDEFVCFVQDSNNDKWALPNQDFDLNFIQKNYSKENEDLLTQSIPHGSAADENYLAESVTHQISYFLAQLFHSFAL